MNRIIGHTVQKNFLEKYIVSKKNHHGFLFVGPESVGKKEIAHTFAHHIVHDKKHIAWDIVDIEHNGDIDIVIPLQEKKRNRVMTHDISVDQIIAAKRSFALSPYNKTKVLIIDDAHKMTVSAQNALLKTLEEPYADRCIILVSQHTDALLDTIVSRCITIQFGSVSSDQLTDLTADNDVSIYQGRPGFFHRYSTDGDFKDIVENARTTLQLFGKMSLHERIKLAENIAKKDDQIIRIFFHVWIHRIHDVAHDMQKWHLLTMAAKIDDTLMTLETTNANKQLAIEKLFIDIGS
jgi:DNA polymerase-3 subunit delta'